MPWITAVLLGAILLLQYPLWLGKGCFPHLQHVEKKLVQQKQKDAELKLRNTAMEAEIQDLKRGLGAIEEHARTELGMVRPSEVLYQYLTPPSAETAMALINPSAAQMLAGKVKEPRVGGRSSYAAKPT